MTTLDLARKDRFSALLSDDSFGRPLYDQPLLRLLDCVVAPTLGAIIPNWLIIVPKSPSLNFLEWKNLHSNNPLRLIQGVTEYLGLEPSDVVWFEHGPSKTGTSVGCGADYAHLHLIFQPPFTFAQLIEQAVSSSPFLWNRCAAAMVYDELDDHSSYLVAGSSGDALYTSDVEGAVSQFFRRAVGEITQAGHTWDYKRFPHHENIELTISSFLNLEHRGRSVRR